MQIGIVGLGRMGGNIARRLLAAGHGCIAFDLDRARVDEIAAAGAQAARDLPGLVATLAAPRVVWIMLPAGSATEAAIHTLSDLVSPGDIIVDGGNTFYEDDLRRAALLAERGIGYVDVGTSGGIWGLERGYSLMIGGTPEAVSHLDPIFKALAPGIGAAAQTIGRQTADQRPEHGYVHAGLHGAGHFAKMVHNAIEYGMMQAFAEGFDILRNAPGLADRADARYEFNLADIAEVWRRGSVVSSWLLDLIADALAKDGQLLHLEGQVDDSGEGRWAVSTAIRQGVPANVLAAALNARFRSRHEHTFGDKLLSAMREEFGGHREAVQPPTQKRDETGPVVSGGHQ
ncbi:MAG: decarboxylating 6-phosphogluconate dehydrogenase [Sphingomonadaceae bacterium]|nr:decarboxylating 6-phosphogluconate dehydrogenase [Sphingomonadaceae bacterium]